MLTFRQRVQGIVYRLAPGAAARGKAYTRPLQCRKLWRQGAAGRGFSGFGVFRHRDNNAAYIGKSGKSHNNTGKYGGICSGQQAVFFFNAAHAAGITGGANNSGKINGIQDG
jgi:hypothetical protein